MPDIAVKPRVLKNYLLKVGTNTFQKAVNSVTFTPSSSTVTFKGGTPDAVFTDQTAPTWTCALNYAQDWETAGSLSQYLLEHEGETVDMEFSPLGTGPKFTAKVIITAGAVGGAIDAFAVAAVTLGVQGKPVFVAGAVTP